jgi:GT2 family glycosyltransferase
MGLVDDSALEIGVHLCKYHWALPGLAAGSAWVAPTANALYSRRILDRLGRFDDQAFCGDAVLSWRAARAGAPPFFEPRAIVFHRHDLSFEQFRSSRFFRGSELARERARHEGWSRRSCYLRAVAFPLGLAWVLCAAARHAARARWTRRFLRTLPIQLVGHAAWSLGEAVALVKQREPLGP